MTKLTLQYQLAWLDFWIGPPRRIRIGSVVINIEDFKKGKK
ncbi:MAG: hypothetical protein SFX19_09990 [Alphaproteobacteria bacterium]|nr:hypothetical protein [Alphaproteobacteria bacterium]